MPQLTVKVDIRLKTRKIETAALYSFGVWVKQLGDEFQTQIGAEKWAWPNETRRKNGTIAGTIRDIVDTGELQGSQRGPGFFDGGRRAMFFWDAPYAVYALKGFRSFRGDLYPGRDWIKGALREKPPAKYVAQYLRGAIN